VPHTNLSIHPSIDLGPYQHQSNHKTFPVDISPASPLEHRSLSSIANDVDFGECDEAMPHQKLNRGNRLSLRIPPSILTSLCISVHSGRRSDWRKP